MRAANSNYGESMPRTDRKGFEQHFRAPGVTGPEKPPEKPYHEGPWGDRPSVAHQAEQMPDTVRQKGAEQYEFFQLPKDIKRLNGFMKRTAPKDAPDIVITRREEKMTETGMHVMLRYVKIEYKQIAPRPSLPPTQHASN